jgi:aspartyl-tRNA(Asn)/glutamyl-tRNA(Gln) amidotransferase subunit C
LNIQIRGRIINFLKSIALYAFRYIPYAVSLIFEIMEVNDALIDKLATLARLQFEPAEKERLKQDLQKMIAFVEQLQQMDTEGELPVLQMSSNTDILREDEIKDTISREDGLRNAPITDGVFFKVPKVINK